MNQKIKVAIVSLSTILLTVLMVGTVLGTGEAAEDAYRHFAVYTEVLSRIKSDYVEEPDMKSVTLGALNGLLESIDPYASYLSADQYKQYLKSKETPKAGVGLILSRRFGYVGVVASIPGSPADKAGLKTGDVLETISGVASRDMPLAYAEILLQGEAGTSVELGVLRVRRGTEAEKVALVRGPVAMPPVTSKLLADGVGLVQAGTLEAGKSKQIAAKIAELERQGAKKLVLDLRVNANGPVEEGIAMARLFVDKGLITYLMGQKVARQDVNAEPAKVIWKQQMVVLVNRGTGAGAEVAAAALLDSKRADVVGERTYGDAGQRKAITLEDGSAVILSVAKYYSPSGKSIQDNGVTPSVLSVETDAAASDDDDNEDPKTPLEAKKPGEDVQLQKAIEVLTKGKSAATAGAKTEAKPGADLPANKPLTPLNVPRPK